MPTRNYKDTIAGIGIDFRTRADQTGEYLLYGVSPAISLTEKLYFSQCMFDYRQARCSPNFVERQPHLVSFMSGKSKDVPRYSSPHEYHPANPLCIVQLDGCSIYRWKL